MGFLMAFLSAIFYSINSVVMKKGMRGSENDNGVFTSLFVNVLILGLLLLIYRSAFVNSSAPLNFLGVALFALAGFLTTFLGRTMFFIGIRKIGTARAAGIKNSSPIFTIFFAIFVLQETIHGGPYLGIFFIFLGLILQGYILYTKESSKASRLGYMITLGSALGFGIGQGIRKQALFFYADPFAGAFIGALVSLMLCALVASYKKTFIGMIKNLAFTNKYYMVGGILTSFALLSFFIAINYINVAYVGAILAIEPILTIVIGKLLLRSDEKVTIPIVICAVFIFLGASIISQ